MRAEFLLLQAAFDKFPLLSANPSAILAINAGGTAIVPLTTLNAATATKLATPRTINGVAFDGSANITVTALDSSKLPLAGGTLTGSLAVNTSGNPLVSVTSTGANPVQAFMQASSASSIAAFGTLNAYPVGLYVNSTECVRVDTSGNVGIGLIPGGSYALEVGRGSIACARIGGVAPAFDLLQSGVAHWQLTNPASVNTFAIVDAGGAPVTRFQISATGEVKPGADNTQTLGSAALRWSVVYAGTGAINTSDAREKTGVAPLTAAEINAAKALAAEIGAYQFLGAVSQKGDGARRHIGMTVQRAIEIMQGCGLDPMRYGFICHDVSEEVDRYGFRTDELLLFIARGSHERLAALEARLVL